jgi:hypothetical protein
MAMIYYEPSRVPSVLKKDCCKKNIISALFYHKRVYFEKILSARACKNQIEFLAKADITRVQKL